MKLLALLILLIVIPQQHDETHQKNADQQSTIDAFKQTGPASAKNTKCFFNFANGVSVQSDDVFEIVEGKDGGEIEKKVRSEEELIKKVKDVYDLFYDPQFGLICNTEFKGWEFGMGQGGIIDLGSVKFENVKELPEKGYHAGLAFKPNKRMPATIKIGNTYGVRTGNGKYAKMQILDINSDKSRIKFRWEYQKNGSRMFGN